MKITYVELIIAATDETISNQHVTQSTTSRNDIPTAAQLLLEDNFNFLNMSLWKRDIKMPLSPVGILRMITNAHLCIYLTYKMYIIKYIRIIRVKKLKKFS